MNQKMNRTKVLSFVFPLLALLFSSCSLETDNDAGRLEGMWHLVRIDDLTAGTTEDMSSKTVFWSFQARLLQLEEKKGTHSSFLYRFSIDGDRLTLSSPYLYDRENGDRPLSVYEPALAFFGIRTLVPAFRIERVRKGEMVLNDGSARLCFDKF